MDHQDLTNLTTVGVPLHGAILQEAIRANAHREEDDMRTMAVTMEGEVHHYQEDDWMTDMDMDHRLHDGHPTNTILTTDEDRHLQVAILTHTEVEIHMLDHGVQYQGMAVAVAMADMKMEVIQDDIGKFFTFLLLSDYPSKGYVATKHQLIHFC